MGFKEDLLAAAAKGWAANNDALGQFFFDPDVALGFVQGTIRRALETHKVTIRYKEGTANKVDGESVSGEVIEYIIDGKAVSEYNTRTGTMMHRLDSSRVQESLMNAHASVYGGTI